MRFFLIFLCLVGLVWSQGFFTVPGVGRRRSSSNRRQELSRSESRRSRPSSSSSRRPSSSSSRRPSSSPSGGGSSSGGPGEIHGSFGDSDYHYSFRVSRGRKFSGSGATSYCKKLGQGWDAVSINSKAENDFIVDKVKEVAYIWTGGKKSGRDWRWPDGSSLTFKDWSHTGGLKRAQPDNRDRNENCLSILNNFYKDGIHWHDVGCSHTKPVICEKRKN